MYEKHVKKYYEILPYEIWMMIVAHLHLKDIASFAWTSKEGRSIARDKDIWTFKAWQHYLIKQSEKIEYPDFIERYHQKYNQITGIEDRKIFSMIIDDDSERLEKLDLSLDRFDTIIDDKTLYYWAYKNSSAICKSIFDKAWKYFYDTTINKIDIKKVDSKGRSILHWAAATQSATLINDLISAGADVNEKSFDGFTPLYRAAAFGHLDVVNTLLASHADVDARLTDARLTNGATPLFYAAKYGDLDVVNALLAYHADVNAHHTEGITPLFYAAECGHLDVVNALLASHADVNVVRAINGSTPLYLAAQNGHLNVVKALLFAHADINAPYMGGITPLYSAVTKGHLDVVEFLLAASADVNARCADGSTPLYVAAHNGHLDIIRVLLTAGADINAHKNGGFTPLYIAAGKGHVDIVDALLAGKADINIIYPSNGKTLFEMATDKKETALLTLLAKHKLIALLNETSKPTVYPQEKSRFSSFNFFSHLSSAEIAAQNHQAALALAEVVLNGATINSLKPHLKILTTGELGKIFKILKPSIEKNQKIKEETEQAFTELKVMQCNL